MAEPSAADVVREALRRWDVGEPLDGLAAPEYEARGEPLPLHTVDAGQPEDRRREIRESAELRVRSVEQGTGNRVLAEAVWILKGDRGGSAGLVWGVFRVRDGQITSVTYFHDEHEARHEAGC